MGNSQCLLTLSLFSLYVLYLVSGQRAIINIQQESRVCLCLTDSSSQAPLFPRNSPKSSLSRVRSPSLNHEPSSLLDPQSFPFFFDRRRRSLSLIPECLSPSSKNVTPSLRRPLITSVTSLDRDASSSSIPMVCGFFSVSLLLSSSSLIRIEFWQWRGIRRRKDVLG